jgi:hypothetical protein
LSLYFRTRGLNYDYRRPDPENSSYNDPNDDKKAPPTRTSIIIQPNKDDNDLGTIKNQNGYEWNRYNGRQRARQRIDRVLHQHRIDTCATFQQCSSYQLSIDVCQLVPNLTFHYNIPLSDYVWFTYRYLIIQEAHASRCWLHQHCVYHHYHVS